MAMLVSGSVTGGDPPSTCLAFPDGFTNSDCRDSHIHGTGITYV